MIRDTSVGMERLDITADPCLDAILSGTRDSIIVLDADRIIRRWSDQTAQMLGFSASEVAGTDWLEYFRPDNRPSMEAQFERVLAGETLSDFEADHCLKDGSVVRAILWLSPVRDEGGSIIGAVEIARDVTERDETSRAIRNSIKRESAIVDTAVDGIVTIDNNRTVLSFNPAAEKIFGYSASEVIGNNVSMLMPHPIKAEHDHYVQDYVETGVRKVIGIGRETFGQRKDGTVFPMYLAVGDVDNSHDIFVGIIRDITEQKRAEHLLVEQQSLLVRQTQELQRSNNELEHFAYVASHDLQEPLRMISSYLELLEESYHDSFDDDAREYMSFAVGGAERLKLLINDLLEYSRIGNGELTVSEFDCRSVLKKAVDAVGMTIKSSGAVIEHEDLPRIVGYETLFVSLFQNLVVGQFESRPTKSSIDQT